MKNRQHQRMIRWTYVGIWVLTIYSTLYIVRPICEFLKANTPFDLIVNMFNFSFFALILSIFMSKLKVRRLSTYGLLFIIIILYTIGFLIIKIPEERIHFFEYGILSFLVVWAFSLDFNKLPTYLFAFIVTSFFGFIDEGIQFFLPNRYYQIEDVYLNAASSALGLLLTFTLNRDRKLKLDSNHFE